MTRLLDQPLRKVAKTVIGKFGTDVTIRQISAAAYNPATGTMTPTNTDTTIRGRLDNYVARELSDIVRASDIKLTIAAADLTFTPTEADKVVYASLVYDVIRVAPELATDQAAIFVLQLRR